LGKDCGIAKLRAGLGTWKERLKARPEQETITRAFTELLESVPIGKMPRELWIFESAGMKADVEAVSDGGTGRGEGLFTQGAGADSSSSKDEHLAVGVEGAAGGGFGFFIGLPGRSGRFR